MVSQSNLLADEFPPAESWAEFVKMRKSIKKPMTAYAEKLMIKRLAAFVADGQDAEAMLNQSIINCWQNIYPVKDEQVQQRAPFPARPPQLTVVEQNARNTAEARRLLGFRDLDDEGKVY